MIRRIEIRNFRVFEHQVVDELAPGMNIFAGENWAGKSTILDAIAICLTGTCRGADGGRGLEELRRATSKRKWQVVLTVDVVERSTPQGDGTELVLTTQQELVRTEGEGPRSDMQRTIEQRVGPPDQIRACLYSGELMRLPKKERQELVMALAQPGAVEVPEAIRKLVPGMPASVTLPDLEAYYSRVYERRRECGAELRGLGTLEPPAAPADLADKLKGVKSATVLQGLAQMDLRLRDLRAKLTGLTLGDLDSARTEARRRIQEQIDEVRARVAATDTDQMDTDSAEIEGKTAELYQKRQACEQRFGDLNAQQAQASALRAAAVEQFEYLNQDQGQCPKCGTKLTEKGKNQRKAELVRELDIAKKALAAIQEQLGEVRSAGIALDTELKRLKHEAWRLEQQSKAFDAAEARIAQLERELEAIKDDPEPTPQAEPREQLEREIGRGDALRGKLAEYVGALRQYEVHAERSRVLTEEHAQLDRLVTELGPSGPLRAEAAAGDELAGFRAFMAQQLKDLGFPCDLKPLLELADDPLVRGLPARMLSRSESTLFSIAFQIVAARWTGLGIVAVDDFEQLDPRTSSAARDMLRASECQSFVFQVLRDKRAFLELAPRFNATTTERMFLVEQGKVLLPGKEAA